MTPILILCLSCSLSLGPGDVPKGDWTDAWQDAVTYRTSDDLGTMRRASRAADWLKGHLILVDLPDVKTPLPVIAWKDPTLEPADPKLLTPRRKASSPSESSLSVFPSLRIANGPHHR